MQYDFRADDVLGPAYDYWRSKCGARALPRRRDIDPTEIRRLLPNIQITEWVDGGKRIRYCLVGTAIVEAYGAELTGKYFDEVFSGERLRFIEANYRTMCNEKKPVLVSNRYYSARNVELFCNRMIMPLSDNGVDINKCFSAMSFRFPREAYEWNGEWFGNSGNFDFTHSHAAIIG